MIECETCHEAAEVVHYPWNIGSPEPGYCLAHEPPVDPKKTHLRDLLKKPGLPSWAVPPFSRLKGTTKIFDGKDRLLP